MTRGRRPLSPEERALWDQIARQAKPLHPPRAASRKQAQAAKPSAARSDPLAPFRIGEFVTRDAAPNPDAGTAGDNPTAPPVRMDRKAFERLKGGKLSPEARIDLHGMTQAQAHAALTAFILRNQVAGRRLVLVITGKGRGEDGDGPIPQRRGILRRQVPHWLHQPPLSGAVLQISQAHRRHGGDGAYYVYLRRLR